MAKLRAVECREFIKAAIEKADEMGVPVSIAVVGPEGNLIALERMDDAGFVTPETAWAKAYTVAAFRSMSPRFPDGLVIQQWFKERSATDDRDGCDDKRPRCCVRRGGAGVQGQRDGRLLWHQRRDLGPG
jgi:Haem-degrading